MTSEHSIEKGKYMKSILFEHTLGFAGPTKNSKKNFSGKSFDSTIPDWRASRNIPKLKSAVLGVCIGHDWFTNILKEESPSQ